MSERSTVVILLNSSAYLKGVKWMKDNSISDENNLLKSNGNVYYLKTGHIILFFEDSKWYSHIQDVGNMMQLLATLDDEEYRFVEVDGYGGVNEMGDNDGHELYAYTHLVMPDLKSEAIKLDPTKYYIFININDGE